MTLFSEMFSYRRAFFFFSAILMVFLVITVAVIVSHEREILHDMHQNAHRESQLVGTFLREALLKYDYATVEQFLNLWGSEDKDLVEIKATAANGFVLVHHRRRSPADYTLSIKEVVRYGERDLLTLEIVKDVTAVRRALFKLGLQLIFGAIGLMILLGTALWYALRKLALQPMEHEIARRTQAEAQLRESNRALQASLDTLQTAQDQLIQSEKMAALGALVAGVAHEINTPVGVGVSAASYLEMKIRELSELFAAEKLKKADLAKCIKIASEATASILNNLNRAADLIRSFKEVAVDQATEERRIFGIKEYIDKVLLSLHPKFKRTRHSITVRCPEDLALFGYPGAFSQIITNFILNSLVHGFEGVEKGKITLEVYVKDERLAIQYSDNGIGMSEDTVKKIFNPFFTTKRGQGGSGLGLYLVYNLVVQKLGGQIECSSAPGRGTQFTIKIPFIKTSGPT